MIIIHNKYDHKKQNRRMLHVQARDEEIAGRQCHAAPDRSSSENAMLISLQVNNRMKLLFFVVGTSAAFSFNVLLSCDDYFMEANPHVHNIAGKFAATAIACTVLAEAMLLPIAHGRPTSEVAHRRCSVPDCMYSHMCQAQSSLGAQAALMVCCMLLSALYTVSFPTVMIVSGFFGALDAWARSGTLAVATIMDPVFTAYLNAGSAFSGLVANFIRLGSRALFSTEIGYGAAVTFGVGILVLFSGMVALWLSRPKNVQRADDFMSCSIEQDGAVESQNERAFCFVSRSSMQIYVDVFPAIWKPVLSCFITFFITLSLFPGVVLETKSSPEHRPSLGDWIAVFLVTAFNLGDLVGRLLSGIETFGILRRLRGRPGNLNCMIWYPTHFRWIFYPLIFLCVLPEPEESWIGPDIAKCALVFFLGLSNGYLTAVDYIAGAELVEGEESRVVAANLVLLFQLAGLMIGAFVGIGIAEAILM